MFCITASVVWGLSFVAQSVSTKSLETFTFNGIRLLLGALVLLPFVIHLQKKERVQFTPEEFSSRKTGFLKGSAACGLAMFFGNNLQQQAFRYIPCGKVGFITALYMVLVPVISLIFFRKKARPVIWVAVCVGMVGLYFLCLTPGEGFSVGRGELLTLACAFAFAAQILAVDRYVSKTNGVILSMGQFFVSGVLSAICALFFNSPDLSSVIAAAPTWLYAGIMSCGVAFTFQILGQRYTEPAVASLLLSLESVFSVIFGWLILKQTLSARELVGCVVMFAAIILSQLPEKGEKKEDAA